MNLPLVLKPEGKVAPGLLLGDGDRDRVGERSPGLRGARLLSLPFLMAAMSGSAHDGIGSDESAVGGSVNGDIRSLAVADERSLSF